MMKIFEFEQNYFQQRYQASLQLNLLSSAAEAPTFFTNVAPEIMAIATQSVHLSAIKSGPFFIFAQIDTNLLDFIFC